MKTTDEGKPLTLREKLANKALVGIRTETWGKPITSSIPMAKVGAKVGGKLARTPPKYRLVLG